MALSTNHPVQLGTTSDVILSTDAAHEGSLSVKECDARSAPTKTRHSYPSRSFMGLTVVMLRLGSLERGASRTARLTTRKDRSARSGSTPEPASPSES